MKNNNSTKPFLVKDATYQSWIVNDNEKGTDIVLIVTNVLDRVTFDSLVFRGIMMPVTVDKEKDSYVIKGTIRSDLSHLKPEKTSVNNKPDQLIYTFKGNRCYFKVQSITRKEMKYF